MLTCARWAVHGEYFICLARPGSTASHGSKALPKCRLMAFCLIIVPSKARIFSSRPWRSHLRLSFWTKWGSSAGGVQIALASLSFRYCPEFIIPSDNRPVLILRPMFKYQNCVRFCRDSAFVLVPQEARHAANDDHAPVIAQRTLFPYAILDRERDKVYSVLLEMMDRARHATCGPYVFFLATCPSSTALDPSLLQRGRLELVVRLGAFDSAARAHVLAIHARDMQLHVKRKSNASMQTTRPPCFSQRNRSGVCRFEDGRYAAVTENGGRHSSLRLQDVSVADDGDDDDPAAGMKEVEGKAATPRALSPTTPRTRDEFLRLVAARCHGCLGSDLERLCREAAMRHMTAVAAAESSIWSEPSRYHSANENGSERDGDCVTLEDFLAALDVVRPASLAGSSVGSFWGGGRGPEVRMAVKDSSQNIRELAPRVRFEACLM